jgi:hypothetical protein
LGVNITPDRADDQTLTGLGSGKCEIRRQRTGAKKPISVIEWHCYPVAMESQGWCKLCPWSSEAQPQPDCQDRNKGKCEECGFMAGRTGRGAKRFCLRSQTGWLVPKDRRLGVCYKRWRLSLLEQHGGDVDGCGGYLTGGGWHVMRPYLFLRLPDLRKGVEHLGQILFVRYYHRTFNADSEEEANKKPV